MAPNPMMFLRTLFVLSVIACGVQQMLVSSVRGQWTSSRIHGTPEPPLPYTTEPVFPSLSFTDPVDMAFLPGTDWLFVMELKGKVFAFDGTQREPHAQLVFDAKEVLPDYHQSYGITFHPEVASNRFVYLSWVEPGTLVEDGTHVCRFELSADDPPRILPETRQEIITWHSGGHNGACLKFGPDGYLYVSAGDGVGPFPPDSEETGQDVGDLRATIFRINVDEQDADRNYSVPSDNPFVDLEGARPEVWAYGFRNPWKMNFNPSNGDLFAGDVGWELWELVYRVEKGGNYGWSVMEGRQPIRSDVVRGPTPILPPIADHHHIEARSVTGGYVYRGGRLPELEGAYIYGDYVTGKLWGLRNDGNRVTWHEELADTPLAVITFGENERGDLFIVDYAGGLHRLKENPRRGQNSEFPRRLSETGLFDDVASQIPAQGVQPYSIVAEPWMEGAVAQRFVALPDAASIKTVRNRMQWAYPPGTVFAKTISLPGGEQGTSVHRFSPSRLAPEAPTHPETDVSGSPRDRMLETQILHYDGEEWRPYTYVWNDEQTDAVLAPAEGGQTTTETPQGRQTWRIHSRAECNTCHTPRAGYTLGFIPQNLMTTGRDDASDQLALLTELDVFASPIPERDKQPAIVDPYDASASLDERARAYLMVNCAHCHRRGGGGTAFLEFPIEHPLEKTNSIDLPPTQGTFNIPHARLIAPGDPYRSVLYYRMATVGRGHMPHLGARQIDDAGLRLIHDWISEIKPVEGATSSPEILRRAKFDGDRADVLAAGSDPPSRSPVDGLAEELEKSTPFALRLIHAIAGGRYDKRRSEAIIGVGSQHESPIIRGLFERFLPEDKRTKRLGTLVNAADILALSGDADRGRSLFVAGAGVQCRNCHQIDGRGREFGPSLDGVGKRLTRGQILESILEPSRRIDAKWVGHTLVSSEGVVLTGMLRHRTDDHVTLRDAQGKDHTFPIADVEEIVAQQKSLMPELLVQDLTAEQLADLLAFLESLREASNGE